MLGSNEGLILPVTHYVVAKAPSCPHGECFPTLFIETNGESGGHAKANQWALQNRGLRAQNTIAADLRVLGRLHDYHLVGWLGEVIRTIDLRQFLLSYLHVRLQGTALIEPLKHLCWAPAPFTTVRSEFRILVRYLVSQENSEHRDILSLFSSNEVKAIRNLCEESTKQTLLSHLAAASARWAELFGEKLPMPSFPIRDTSARSSTYLVDRTMDLEEVQELVDMEANPFYKAIWLLAAFGGPRSSEILHMWQCDVLPPTSGELITGYRLSTPLVLIANPTESRYTGDLTRLGKTRSQHLQAKYGLESRNMVSGYRHVGWKHPIETDRNLRTSQVFWSDERQANAFAETIAEVRHFHSKNRTSERHPWLWVNSRAGSGFGSPIASSQLRKAFDRACKRAGLRPHINGRRPHGLRHAYKLQLELAGLTRKQIQIAMRHQSIESQDDYGRETRELRRRLDIWSKEDTSWR